MNIKYPGYRNCIANLACSLLQYYGVTPPNPTLPQASEIGIFLDISAHDGSRDRRRRHPLSCTVCRAFTQKLH